MSKGRRVDPASGLGEALTLPYSLEAERAVLGAILLHPDAYDHAADLLEAGDFFRVTHAHIFAAMGCLQAAKRPIELLTLREELGRRGELDEPAYITALVDGVPRSTNIEAYAAIVREKARLRATIKTATDLTRAAYDEQAPSAELVADAADKLLALGGDPTDGAAVFLKDLIAPSMETLEASAAVGGTVTGLQTGFTELDELMSGLHGGDLTVVAARTSQGKTALAMNIARHAARTVNTLVFSMEMSKEQLFMRLLSSEARVDSHRLRTGHLAPMDWTRISEGLGALQETNVLVDDTGHLGVRDVRARARQVQAKHGLGLIVIDYFQLMHGRGRFDNRTQELGTVSRGLKAVARELAVPIVLLSQLSRNAEPQPGRKARRPQLSDLAECGSLENDADNVIFIYRPEPKADDPVDADSIAEAILAKQRNGPTGIVKLHWSKAYVRFENVSMV